MSAFVKPCEVCGSNEPFHIHDTINYSGRGEPVIRDYFLIGRFINDAEAARAWQKRALHAEQVVDMFMQGLPERQVLDAAKSNIEKRYLDEIPS